MKKNTFTFTIGIAIAFICSILFACNNDNELDIQQNFPFELHIMPVPKEIKEGQKVEIRFTIVPTGNYKNRHYNEHNIKQKQIILQQRTVVLCYQRKCKASCLENRS